MFQGFVQICGWVPAVVFPAGTLVQLVKIVQAKNADGVSVSAWLLFGLANICLYIYAEKYSDLQAILGFLGTAAADLAIVATCVVLSWRSIDRLQSRP